MSVPVPVSREKTLSIESTSQHPVSKESTSLQGTALEQDVNPPPSPNDYTSTDGYQTSGGDEGDEGKLDTYALTREFRRMKKVINAQADQIKRLRNKFRRLKRFVWPLVQNHILWVKQKMRSAKKSKKASKSKLSKKRSSSFILGRN